MCKDKKMLALIAAIFLSVILITGWVFADRSVMDLINVTPILEVKNTAPAPARAALPAVQAAVVSASDPGMCMMDGCQ